MSPDVIRRIRPDGPGGKLKLRVLCVLAAFCSWSSLANTMAYINFAISLGEQDAEALGREHAP
jgi:hypothetical protein